MTTSVTRLGAVFIGLVLITSLSLGFTSDAMHGLLSLRGAAAAAAVIAFIKARYVVLDFMELRGTAMQLPVDLWLLVVGAISLVLTLR
ncbi:cytochrome C oxidase subunit IV family protein [Pseudomonas sp. GD03721]|nr:MULTISPECIES: cytochrome C oxidase subunit IV family protein [unclassified Pseudomonas]MDH1440499.1 cytochrome C oxidase subunit IV family protein [Pseudomonas sp. GD03722]WGG03414.1 cytochrome C oxidase subunit IV family protein [Pseudomonas sp. GD03721]WGG07582.1 cytochrome C oxidase subunit IV family protein [Pseudomonas sp. GD03919]